MSNRIVKYILTVVVILLCGEMLFGYSAEQRRPERATKKSEKTNRDSVESKRGRTKDSARGVAIIRDSLRGDSVVTDTVDLFDTTRFDSLLNPQTLKPLDTTRKKSAGFLDEVVNGKNKDSLVYDVKSNMVYIYRDGDITYKDMNLKADYMKVNLEDKNVYAYGYTDTAGVQSRPQFVQKGQSYTMDTINYNFKSEKAKIKGVTTQEGEGYLIGKDIKKMPDNTINIARGKYTTCADTTHPHFYLAMSKAKAIPGKKIIVGPSYFVMEDVPIYFLGLPFGFFPMTSGRKSGFIVPSYGEESIKGFFIRDGGYYFAFNDYVDVTLTGGFYTLGSWETAASSRYLKRYKYSGNLNMRFSKDIIGEKWMQDYTNQNNFNITWTHTQDPKFRPNSSFAASVNFSSSGYSKNGSTNMNDYLNTQTNSSISYSKSWAGTPFSFSTNLAASQNSNEKLYNISFPNAVLNMSRIFPFKRREAVGKQRWYEKISMSYTGTVTNSATAKEDELFTDEMFKSMKNGINHSIPISTSMNLFKYINISPSANYTERWYFQKVDQNWDADQNQIARDTTYGFYRIWNYSVSASASTKVYGTFQFNDKFPVRAIRHVMTPSVGISYTPNFGDPKYGYYKPVQQDSTGRIGYYSPYETGAYGVPGRGQSASISFSLQNTLEMKVKSERDTTGVKKVKLIDNFSISSSYNLLADSLNLSPFSLSLRTTLPGNFGFNITATLDPYEVDPVTGRRINQFMWKRGKIGRITNANWSFGYTFNNSKKSGGRPAINDINSGANVVPPEYTDFFSDPKNQQMDPNLRRMMMSQQYYDFSIPWNLGFNYTFNYTNNGLRKNVIQTFGFNCSVNFTEKWGATFNGGYDFEMKTFTPGVVTITRDLHCWQMNLSWVPVGYRKSWSFNIGVVSSMLKDIKYDKTQSYYDNIYE